MIKLRHVALCAALATTIAVAMPAFAEDLAGVPADAGAVAKDKAVEMKDAMEMAKDRATKAQDKASGNWAGQAVDSIVLGYDHVAYSEKSAEESTDKTILNHDATPEH